MSKTHKFLVLFGSLELFVEFWINRNMEERVQDYLSGSSSSGRFNPAPYGLLDPQR